MAKAVQEFVKSNPKYVEEIQLVIFQQKMVNDFITAISKIIQPGEGWGGKLMKSVKGMNKNEIFTSLKH